MPNWVKTRIVSANKEALFKAIVNEKGEVDFNQLIPMPEDLRITSGSTSYNEQPNGDLVKHHEVVFSLIPHYNNKKTQAEFLAEVKADEKAVNAILDYNGWNEDWWASNEERQTEALENYVKGFFNAQRYGYTDWYNWSCDNWGTKWNACDSEVLEEQGIIEFSTAWALADVICRKIAEIVPIRVVYADEDMGYNCGMIDFYKNEYGEVVEEEIMEGSVELAYDTWGYGSISVYDDDDYEEIEDENDERVKEANKDFFNVQEKINSLMTEKAVKEDYAERLQV